MTIKLEMPELTDLRPRIAVIGVGGAGGNAINNMIASGLSGVEFIAANTDAQALAMSSAERRLQLGVNLTEGLGAGARPEVGEAAAEEALEEIRSELSGAHMVFIAAGMGGGTGTGAASVIARCAREMGILTVGIVSKPFHFEGTRRMRIAEYGIEQLRGHVDTLIVIPNQNLFRIANERTTFAEAFVLADQVLYSGIACIVDLIMKDGLINLDFADVRAVMTDMGSAVMGTGEAEGSERAILAAEEALANPLLDEVMLSSAEGVLISIVGGPDLTLYEVDEAAGRIRADVAGEANIIVGATFDSDFGQRLRVSLVAAGMDRAKSGAPLAHGPGQASAGHPVSDDRSQNRMMQAETGGSQTRAVASQPVGQSHTGPVPTTTNSPDRVSDERGSSANVAGAQAAGPLPFSALPPPLPSQTFVSPSAASVTLQATRSAAPVDVQEEPAATRTVEKAVSPTPSGSAVEVARDTVATDAEVEHRADTYAQALRGPSDDQASGNVASDTAPQQPSWMAANGVTIEPARATAPAPAAIADPPPGEAPEQAAEAAEPPHAPKFEPAATEEARRASSRFPSVDEFPPVGQREYHAKSGGHAADQSVASAPPARRGGLFGRLSRAGLGDESTAHQGEEPRQTLLSSSREDTLRVKKI